MAVYVEYKPRRILNVYKHCDGGWFWNRYSANPYVGCEYGCNYCYLRSRKYTPYENPEEFKRIIKVKVNAPELLERELSRVKVDILGLGFYQPVEAKYRLLRKMLKICLEKGFPLHMNEKSTMLLEDVDLLREISRRSWLAVSFSLITLREDLRVFEPRTPSPWERIETIRQLSKEGIHVGIAMIPILPYVYDDEENIETVVREVKRAGGKYVIAGCLTLDRNVYNAYLPVLRKVHPEATRKTMELYAERYEPPPSYQAEIGGKVKEICIKHGIDYRLKRPEKIYPKRLRLNRKLAADFYLKAYELELQGQKHRAWAYRKAAWVLDDLEKPVEEIYSEKGLKGLLEIPSVGRSIAEKISVYINSLNT